MFFATGRDNLFTVYSLFVVVSGLSQPRVEISTKSSQIVLSVAAWQRFCTALSLHLQLAFSDLYVLNPLEVLIVSSIQRIALLGHQAPLAVGTAFQPCYE
jgi:hypothetical protein